ncbi:MAG TPA: hypothetical protein VGL15_15160, partial [Vicinamibacteria bacterium]
MSGEAAPATTCPRCGQAEVSGPACPRCGVVLAKARQPRSRPAPVAAVEERPRSSGVHWLMLLAAVATGGWLGLRALRPPPPAPPREASVQTGLAGGPPAAVAADLPPPRLPGSAVIVVPPPVEALPAAAGLPAEDTEKASGLSARIRAGTRLAAADIDTAEDLY